MTKIIHERTLVIFKPDVVQRQIVGEFISRFEKKGFKIVGMKLVWAKEELVAKHYVDDESYLKEVGDKAVSNSLARGEKITETDPIKIGQRVRQWNIDYLICGPVLAIVLQGPTIVEAVRKIVGSSNPQNADVGTIRADYSPDSFLLANEQGRTTRTLIHASDSVENANREIKLWFSDSELCDYETAMEKVLFDAGWTSRK